MVVRFAIVLGRAIAADHSLAVRQHDNKLVAAVHSALAVFVRGAVMNDAQLIEALERTGCEHELAIALVEVVPTAFFRVEMADSGASFSPCYQRIHKQRGLISREQRLDDLPLYVAAVEVARSGVD